MLPNQLAAVPHAPSVSPSHTFVVCDRAAGPAPIHAAATIAINHAEPADVRVFIFMVLSPATSRCVDRNRCKEVTRPSSGTQPELSHRHPASEFRITYHVKYGSP